MSTAVLGQPASLPLFATMDADGKEKKVVKTRRLAQLPVSRACVACRKLKMKCGDTRPCTRCIAKGQESTCVDWTGETHEPRAQVPRACEACKRAKARCDLSRPCSRCIKNGRGDSCCDWNSSSDLALVKVEVSDVKQEHDVVAVERPLSYNVNRVGLADDITYFQTYDTQHWAYPLMARFSEYSQDQILNLAYVLPPSIQNVVSSALSTFKVIQNHTMQKRFSHDCNLLMGDQKDTGVFEMMENEIWERSQDTGFMRMKWDMIENMMPVRQELYVSDLISTICGIHKEEFITRLTSKNVPIFMTELDWICYMIEEILNDDQLKVCKFYRCRDSWGSSFFGCGFYCFASEKVFDGNGTLVCSKHYIRPVSKEEFEQVRMTTPESCRPFASEMGDNRSADELQRDFISDYHREETISRMKETEAGQKKLQLLAMAVQNRLQHFVKIADRIRMKENSKFEEIKTERDL